MSIKDEEEKKAPLDLPPDSSGIAQDRFSKISKDYVSRVINHQKIFKKHQAKINDIVTDSTNSGLNSSRLPSSPTS